MSIGHPFETPFADFTRKRTPSRQQVCPISTKSSLCIGRPFEWTIELSQIISAEHDRLIPVDIVGDTTLQLEREWL